MQSYYVWWTKSRGWNGGKSREKEWRMDGGRGDGRNKVRQRGREAPLIGRWHGGTLQLPWGYMNPGAAFSLFLPHPSSLSLSPFLCPSFLSLSLSLSLSLCFSLFHPPSHTVYPRYDFTPRQNAGASHGPRNDQYELPQLDLVSLLLAAFLSFFHIHSALSSSY